jgi:fibronectin type 3 domain-containing protein
MRHGDSWTWRRTWTILPALLALVALAGCEPGDDTWLACLFGDRVACLNLLGSEPPGTGKPVPPRGLTAQITESGVTLDWTDSSESDVVTYQVYQATYDRNGELRFDSIGAVTVTTSGFIDEFPHRDGTTYFYRVTAVDADLNESDPSEAISVVYCTPGRVCAAVPGPPAAPTGLTYLQAAAGITLDWNDNTETDLESYFVYLATASGAYTTPLFFVRRDDVPAMVDSAIYGLVPFTTYYFSVSAVDNDGEGLEGPRSEEVAVFYCPSTVAGCPAAPGGVTGLRPVSRDAIGISLDWDVPPGPAVDRYVVYRSPFSNHAEPDSVLAYTTESALVDHQPDDSFSNHYLVAAVAAGGHRGPLSSDLEVSWCGAANPTCRRGPAAPTGLTATRGPFLVALDWADNAEADLAGYNVELAFDAAGPWSGVNRALLTASEYTVLDLPGNRAAFFRVTAVDPGGNVSPPSTVVSATPCQGVCVGTTPSQPSAASRQLAGAGQPPAAARRPAPTRHRPVPFKLTVAGQLDDRGRASLDGTTLVGKGFGFAGAFTLDRRLKGWIPEVGRLARHELEGSWRAQVDWRLDPAGHTGTATGVALASFEDGRIGKACLRFDETYALKRRHRKLERIVTHGQFTLLGGTGAAATLLGEGRYRVKIRSDGTLVYHGESHPAPATSPGLPPECQALERP